MRNGKNILRKKLHDFCLKFSHDPGQSNNRPKTTGVIHHDFHHLPKSQDWMWVMICGSRSLHLSGVRKLAFRSDGFDDFAFTIGNRNDVVSGKDFDQSADIASIYGLEPSIAFAKYGKYRQVTGKLCESLLRGQREFKWCLPSSH